MPPHEGPAPTDTPIDTRLATASESAGNVLRLRRIGIDTYQEPVLYISSASPVCRAEGWDAHTRVQVTYGARSIVATLNVVTDGILSPDEASLSEVAWRTLGAREGAPVTLSSSPPLESLRFVRAKIYGERLMPEQLSAIIRDIAAGRYSAIELAAFVTACANGRMEFQEVVALTRAMIEAGDRIDWGRGPVMDKHSVGGLPGNRTTLVVVPIVAAHGLMMPKTSSRAITSPAGTADAMETIAPVALDLPAIRRVVEREGGCIVWGEVARLSPADDIIIRVERPLDLDSGDQLVASILSKKVSAGSQRVVIDLPVGPTAKVRSEEAAVQLEMMLVAVGHTVGIDVAIVRGDGSQPIGRGIGPALEARDALAVLRCASDAPADLRRRSLTLAGRVLELGGAAPVGQGVTLAAATLDDGRAWHKFQGICEAQGGMREPPRARLTSVVTAPSAGRVVTIDNRRLARIAKLAGAPRTLVAGLEMHVALGSRVERGAPLLTVHADAPGELAYALAYVAGNPDIIGVGEGA